MSEIHILFYQNIKQKNTLITELLTKEKDIILHIIPVLSSIKRYQSLYSNLCVIYDCEMPSSNDINELKKIKEEGFPVLVLTSQSKKNAYVYEQSGIQMIEKPEHLSIAFVHALIVKIKFLSMPAKTNVLKDLRSMRIVVIGASTGGPRAIEMILKELKVDTCGVIIVQHMNDENLQKFAGYLNEHSSIHVKDAQENELVRNGHVYLANEKRHLVVQRQKDGFHMHYTTSEKVNCVCPSIDVLFQSVANQAGCLACGVLLTGMGEDGASGLKAMKDKGAFTIIQDEKTCDVYGMPKVAKAKHAHCIELPLQQIAPFLNGFEKSYQRNSKERENERENNDRR